jgi:murein DD-endopeptidase MepM/ murein hydrolase activator NlpD
VTLAKTEYATGTDNIFTWPVESRRITTYFHDPSYYALIGSQHEAIDIGTPQGSLITAPADGYVYYILAPAPGNYSYIAIKHKDGFVSVYGHLSEVDVTPYQFVRQGEVIAKSGGTP